MAVVKLKQLFAAVYNSIDLPLTSWSFLPPILAAAVQSIPDPIILRNSPVCSDNKDWRETGSGCYPPPRIHA